MRTFLILFCSIVAFGCSSNNEKLTKKIKQSCSGENKCLLEMSDLTDFSWDKMFVFREGTELEEINKVLGFKYPYFEDVASRIIFVKSNQVVYHEDEFPDPSNSANERVIFIYPNDTSDYMIFSVDNAKFNLIKSKVGGTYYYELFPVDSPDNLEL